MKRLARLLADAIAARVRAGDDEADVVAEMARAAGIDPGTVRGILRGDIETPPMARLRGFARVLNLKFSDLEAAVQSARAAAPMTAMMAALAMPAATDAAPVPEWVHLFPGIRAETVDGRGPYTIADAEAVIAASFAHDDRLVLDENHATDLAGPLGASAPARGWIVEMAARDDGIWGRVEWNASGRALIEDRAYRAISPVILHDKAGRVLRILRASLVNKPNLRGLAALNRTEGDMTLLERLIQALGADPAASEDEVTQAVTALHSRASDGEAAAMQAQVAEIGTALGLGATAAPAQVVAAARRLAGNGGVVPALQAQVAQLTEQLNEIGETQARARAEAFVDGEIARRRAIGAGMRDHYVAMHMADPTRVEREIGALPIMGRSGTGPLPPQPKDGTVALNAEQAAVARMLGLDPKDYAKALEAERAANEEAL